MNVKVTSEKQVIVMEQSMNMDDMHVDVKKAIIEMMRKILVAVFNPYLSIKK